MFIGQYQHSLDAKGRIAVPAKFRSELGETIIINRYLDGCLAIYSMEGWQKRYDELMTLNQNKSDVRKYVRAMTAQAYDLTYDAQGRINLPMPLIELAGLKKDCIFNGAGNHVELWSEDAWNAYNTQLTDEEIISISENL